MAQHGCVTRQAACHAGAARTKQCASLKGCAPSAHARPPPHSHAQRSHLAQRRHCEAGGGGGAAEADDVDCGVPKGHEVPACASDGGPEGAPHHLQGAGSMGGWVGGWGWVGRGWGCVRSVGRHRVGSKGVGGLYEERPLTQLAAKAGKASNVTGQPQPSPPGVPVSACLLPRRLRRAQGRECQARKPQTCAPLGGEGHRQRRPNPSAVGAGRLRSTRPPAPAFGCRHRWAARARSLGGRRGSG